MATQMQLARETPMLAVSASPLLLRACAPSLALLGLRIAPSSAPAAHQIQQQQQQRAYSQPAGGSGGGEAAAPEGLPPPQGPLVGIRVLDVGQASGEGRRSRVYLLLRRALPQPCPAPARPLLCRPPARRCLLQRRSPAACLLTRLRPC